jgi:hypothetical protein
VTLYGLPALIRADHANLSRASFTTLPKVCRRAGVCDYLARNGTIDVEVLYEHPFTAQAPGGPEDPFPDSDVGALVDVLNQVRDAAIPADEVA